MENHEQAQVDWNASILPPQPPNDDDDDIPMEVYTYDQVERTVRRTKIVHTARDRCSERESGCALRIFVCVILIVTAIAWKVSSFQAFEKRAQTEIFHHKETVEPSVSPLFLSNKSDSPTP